LIGLATVTMLAIQPRSTASTTGSRAQSEAVAAAATESSVLTFAPVAEDEAPVAEVASATPEAAAAEPEQAVEAPAKPFVHTVEEGETIRMLAARFSLSPTTILSANNLTDPDMLQVGQELTILPTDGVLYTLHDGESLRKVADRYGIELADIIKANDLGSNPDVVQPGTQLVVPGAEPVQPSAQRVAQGGDSDQQAAAVGGGTRLPVEPEHVAPSTRTYEVQNGDTLHGIADTFGVDVDTILSSNGIDDPDTIKPGSELRILPVKGLEYTVQSGETLADISYKYQIDLGLLLDYNDLNDPDVLHVGSKLVVPGGKLRADAVAAPAVEVPVARTGPAGAAVAQPAAPAPKPAPKPAAAPVAPAPQVSVGRGGATIVANAMKFQGYRYVFGGTSPAGFDCSGFVFYIHNSSGAPVGRGMWQQYNGGAHIPISSLQPGDTVFFANTYMPGLSHDGIYIGGGQFIHASDERTGVTISSINSSYWAAHYVGATRLWN